MGNPFEPLEDYANPIAQAINDDYLAAEDRLVRSLAAEIRRAPDELARVEATATELVEAVRRDRAAKSGIDAFLNAYDLSSAEGVALMCLAEALLRIPDSDTADALIADRIRAGDWSKHLGESQSWLVNASTWGLMLTGRVVQPDAAAVEDPADFVRALVARIGEPVVRGAMIQAMRIMGNQFVMGRTIEAALERSRESEFAAYRFSFDMLGEAARTEVQAQGFAAAYRHAIDVLAPSAEHRNGAGPGISIKLSALWPRFEPAHAPDFETRLMPRLIELVAAARDRAVPVTIDAEEASRQELTLAAFEQLRLDRRFQAWPGLGLAVQAYQRRASDVLAWLERLAARCGVTIPVRLVKGAYWDTEIKRAQQAGLESFPVFTRKVSTDVSYLACARRIFAARGRLDGQFATHNAYTVAAIMHMAPDDAVYEFQRLHGMGDALYDYLLEQRGNIACRVYAPVGEHEELLPYLVRRLLENGANTSFVNRISDEDVPVAELTADPVSRAESLDPVANPGIPAPRELFANRRNSAGLNLDDSRVIAALGAKLAERAKRMRQARPLIGGRAAPGEMRAVVNPADTRETVGEAHFATPEQADEALEVAAGAFRKWSALAIDSRCELLEAAAAAFEQHRDELIALCVLEAGKCIPDAQGELREAVDFLRYYAAEARRVAARPLELPASVGERNHLTLDGRGVFVCISPWNFPLAIFTGQVAAALVTGNTVVAKPAEQTSLVGARAIELLHAAGVPGDVLNFVPGAGDIGQRLVSHPSAAGVVFTGSTATSQAISRALAARDGALAVLIAETGGQNAIIADSTALIEQLVTDVAYSAFNSAGQRCSAARFLLVQDDVADAACEMLAGYMEQLVIGNPADMRTDIGPVIDGPALQALCQHRDAIAAAGRTVAEPRLPAGLEHGWFMPPVAVEISDISAVKEENFGPILHIARFRAGELDAVLDALSATGYGLTLGIHTRIESRAQRIAREVPVGNVYVNRNIVGAVVGAQPFGGRGLSGTGPKAGGPHYLLRFMTEKTVSTNTAALGGDAALMSLGRSRDDYGGAA